MMRRIRWGLWTAVVIAAGLLVLFAVQLQRPKSDYVQSAMVGQPVPAFDLPQAVDGTPALSSADLADGQPKLLNFFGSWCIPCRIEAPQLEALRAAGAPIVGVALKDTPDKVSEFLEAYGNPFVRIGRDDISETQFAFGASGVPETFVIDGKGTITYQYIGPIAPDDVPLLLEKLREAGE